MKKNTKKIIWIASVIAILFVLYKKLNRKYYFTNSKEKVTVKKGQTFDLTFPWAPSSGPSQWWTFDNEGDIDIVEKVGEEFISKTPSGMVGGGGDMVMKYKAVKKGTQTMHWTKGKGTERETVRTIGIQVK